MEKKFVCTPTEPIVQTKAGKIRGYCFDGTYTFHGIQYAQAERFQMPAPVQSWDGIKDAFDYGHVAPLLEPPEPNLELFLPHMYWSENEKCQYLNVWSQSIDPAAKKPVMVWLHGGAYFVGSSIEMIAYEGDSLSRYGDVVVVTLNHRLNILGYLDLSSFGEQYANSGNAGMADIVEALKWVRENISGFGGDPDNVTIFGQSGGGGKVISLCQIPAAAGLFHKAIVMSGVLDFSFTGVRDDKAVVTEMLRDLGIAAGDVGKLETLPYAQLARAYRRAGKALAGQHIQFFNAPFPNDWYLGDPLVVGFSENAKKIPMIVGTVIAEMSSYTAPPKDNALSAGERRELVAKHMGGATDELIRLFKKAYPGKNEVDLLNIDSMFRALALKFLKQRCAASDVPVYSYQFALEYDYNGGKLAWHSGDIPFAFHNTDKVPICNVSGVTGRLVEQYCGAFVNFARTGNPNHAALPQWPAFTKDNQATMVFDAVSHAKTGYDEELVNLLEKSTDPFRPDMSFNDVD